LTANDAIFNSGTFNGNITSSATISGGTISGATITSTGTAAYTGTLTLDGGFIKQTSGMYLEAPNFTYASSVGNSSYGGYLELASTGRAWIGHSGTFASSVIPNVENSLNFTINRTDPGDGYRGRGYNLFNLDATEFKAPSINAAGIGYKTVVVAAYGQLYNGRTFYYGSAGSSSAINSEIGLSQVGDVYFSTV